MSQCASSRRILTYSHYTGQHAGKVPVGALPGGLTAFVSNGFGGKASDKASVTQSPISDLLCRFEDDVMIDKGFNIDDMRGKHRLGVAQPPFLHNTTKFSSGEAKKRVGTVREWVHVKTAIQ